MEEQIKFSKTEKNKDCLIYQGFVFYLDKKLNEKTIWKCAQYYSTKCRARLHIHDSVIEKKLPDLFQHNHAAEAAELAARQHMANIVHNSRNSEIGSTQQVICKEISSISDAAAAKMPLERSIKRTIRRVRNKHSNVPHFPLPKDRKSLVIPECYKSTIKGDTFLLHDSLTDETYNNGANHEHRFIIFASKNFLNVLARSNFWYADGTFEVCGYLFKQLFTIHALQYGINIPIIYALLPNKSEKMYCNVLEILRKEEPNLAPEKIMVDFELAEVNAFRKKFPGCAVSCCYFHLKQSLYRNLASSGLKSRYDNEAIFAMHINMIASLAFVEPEKVPEYFDLLISSNILTEVEDFIMYFEDNYIGRLISGTQRRQPRFPINLWNVYHNTLIEDDRTNNKVEGWHRGFKDLVSVQNPNIWTFFKKIIDEQSRFEFIYEQHLSGGPSAPKRRIYKDLDAKLKTIVMKFSATDPLEYLRALAHNIKIKTI